MKAPAKKGATNQKVKSQAIDEPDLSSKKSALKDEFEPEAKGAKGAKARPEPLAKNAKMKNSKKAAMRE